MNIDIQGMGTHLSIFCRPHEWQAVWRLPPPAERCVHVHVSDSVTRLLGTLVSSETSCHAGGIRVNTKNPQKSAQPSKHHAPPQQMHPVVRCRSFVWGNPRLIAKTQYPAMGNAAQYDTTPAPRPTPTLVTNSRRNRRPRRPGTGRTPWAPPSVLAEAHRPQPRPAQRSPP
jgi:hypothetical protein